VHVPMHDKLANGKKRRRHRRQDDKLYFRIADQVTPTPSQKGSNRDSPRTLKQAKQENFLARPTDSDMILKRGWQDKQRSQPLMHALTLQKSKNVYFIDGSTILLLDD